MTDLALLLLFGYLTRDWSMMDRAIFLVFIAPVGVILWSLG